MGVVLGPVVWYLVSLATLALPRGVFREASATVALLVGVVGFGVYLTRALIGSRPARLVVEAGAFVAPAGRRSVLQAVQLLCPSGGIFLMASGHSLLPPGWRVGLAAVGVLCGIVGLWSSFWLLRREPIVELHPDGVRQGSTVGSVTVPWEALDVPNANQRVPIVDRDAVAKTGLRRRPRKLILDALAPDVNPVFTADVIRYYLAHPEHRGAIGTDAEYDRMLADLAAQFALSRNLAT